MIPTTVTASVHLYEDATFSVTDLGFNTVAVRAGEFSLFLGDRESLRRLQAALAEADEILAVREAAAMAADEQPGTDESPEA